MKKNKIFNLSFLGAMTLAAFCACSSSDDIVDVTDTESGTSDGSMYLGVNISMTDGSTTRATGEYVDGDEKEYYVNSENSYFLFYDNEGNPMTYGTLTDVTWENSSSDNVTSYAAVVSNMFDEEFPSQMIAVLNYNGDIKELTDLTISELEEVTVEDTYGEAGKFTMSNAVTISTEESTENTEGTEDFTYITEISSDNFTTTIEEAADHSVDLYVEREIAKVKIDINSDEFTTGTDTTTTLENIIYYDGTSYKNLNPTLTLDGWGINATNEKGYLVKKTENLNVEDYTSDSINWYNTDDHRFFWAEDINYTYSTEESEEDTETDDNAVNYLSYSEVAGSGLPTAAAYYHENTVDKDGQLAIEGGEKAMTPTLVVAGTITINDDEEGETTEAKTRDEEETTDSEEEAPDLFYYAGVYYNTKGLLTAIYKSLDETYYTDASMTTELTADVLTGYTVTFTSDGQGGAVIESIYNNSTAVTVYNEDNESGTSLVDILNDTHFIYNNDDADEDEDEDEDTQTSYTSYYKNGKCYYQKPIVHLDLTDDSDESEESDDSSDETEEVEEWCGIVRNHYYNITLNSITSIGGPVSGEDEELTIIPGEDENYYIQAEINILSWREVDQTVDF